MYHGDPGSCWRHGLYARNLGDAWVRLAISLLLGLRVDHDQQFQLKYFSAALAGLIVLKRFSSFSQVIDIEVVKDARHVALGGLHDLHLRSDTVWRFPPDPIHLLPILISLTGSMSPVLPNLQDNKPSLKEFECASAQPLVDVLRADAESRKSARKSSWKGVLKIAVFFLLVAVIALLLNTMINFGLRGITVSKFGVFNKIISGEVNADIIISGSSRALSHYDARTIQSATGRSTYNIGMNASQIDFQLTILQKYLANNTRPRP